MTKHNTLITLVSFVLALVVCVGTPVSAQQPDPAAVLEFTEPTPIADIVTALGRQMGLGVIFDDTISATWHGEVDVDNYLGAIDALLEPHGFEAVIDGRTLHVQRQSQDLPESTRQRTPTQQPFRSLASAVVSDAVQLTGPTWLDVNQAQHDAWAAYNAATAPLRQVTYGGYGNVYPQFGVGFGGYPYSSYYGYGAGQARDWQTFFLAGDKGLVGFDCESERFCRDTEVRLDGCVIGTASQMNSAKGDARPVVAAGQHELIVAKKIDGTLHALKVPIMVTEQAARRALDGEKYSNIRLSRDRYSWPDVDDNWIPPTNVVCKR
ncbi:MAG: hypothetical protein HYW51_00140 [Candidatus Doudnabacteria bacterium]|nr:hypothetical protein [Candidatus Doudnabacteria bacterium]